MSYPSAPWHLQGYSLQTLHLIDVEWIRSLIPSNLKIVSVLPGKTLGGIYVASYETGSTLVYNELIVVSALVYASGKVGSWISHIYVDHPLSIAGGREIWGLPKQSAQFIWDRGQPPAQVKPDQAKSARPKQVQIQQGGQLLCKLDCQWQLPGWRQSLHVPVFSMLSSKLLWFEGAATFKFNFSGVSVTVPLESDLARLNLGQPCLGSYANPVNLTANIPLIV